MVGAEIDHGFRELEAAIKVGKERAGAALHVEDEARQSLGELLRHDARADERNTLDRGRRIAQRVQLAIGRCDLARLAN